MSADGKKPPYMLVFGGLALLTAIEVGIAFLGFSRNATIIILLLLAVWKALLVALYFMHMKWESNALRWLALAPFGPAAIMVIVVLMEYV